MKCFISKLFFSHLHLSILLFFFFFFLVLSLPNSVFLYLMVPLNVNNQKHLQFIDFI